jgi:hypothetical protein
MSKLLNLGKPVGAVAAAADDEKRNSDHSDNEADADFQRAMFYKQKAEVDVSLFGRKLHRRRKLKNSKGEAAPGGAVVVTNPSDLPRDSPRMRMLNAKGGGGASGWWNNRRGSHVAVAPGAGGGTGDNDLSAAALAPSGDPKLKDLEAQAQSSSDEEDDFEVPPFPSRQPSLPPLTNFLRSLRSFSNEAMVLDKSSF